MTQENNPAILAYRAIESFIDDITDINSYRNSLPSGDSNKQWIFPSVPTRVDEMYPRVTIRLNSIRHVPQGAGEFFETSYSAGSATADTFGDLVELDFDVFVFVKRKQEHSVTLLGELTAKKLKNNIQTVYMMNQVSKSLLKNRDGFVTAGFEEVEIGTEEAPYEDGEHFWASKIPMTLRGVNTWGDDYTSEDLIDDYDVAITAARS